MKKGSLENAARLFNAGRYAEIIRLLEPQIFKYRESSGFYKLLGLSCLYTGDISGAQSYLKRGEQLRGDDAEILLGLAVIHLRKQETAEAIQIWFDILDHDPKNRKARLGLELLKKNSDPDRLGDLVDTPRYKALLPGTAIPSPGRRIAGIAAGVIVIAAFAIIGILYWPKSSREAPDLTIRGLDLIDSSIRDPVFELEERDVVRAFDAAKKHFMEYRDNLARIELNRIVYSNASIAVKEMAALLASYLGEPDFVTFRDNVSYASVSANPYLYADCHVVWRGRMSNLRIDSERMRFDLLVGYEDGKVLEGIIPTVFDFAVVIDSAASVEVLGKIRLTKEGIALEGVSIHQILPKEQ